MDDKNRDALIEPIGVDQPGIYRIRIQGRLSEGTTKRFGGLRASVTRSASGVPVTTLTGCVADQAALHGIVARVRDLGMPLILVELLRPDEPLSKQGEMENE